jgi:Spy/CpxP family protein refolding chaperone
MLSTRKIQKGVGEKMFLKRNLIGIPGLVLTFGLFAFAQQPEQTQTPDGTLRQERIERKERHRERMGRHKEMRGMRGHGGMGRWMGELNLTDTQREQIRTITERRVESLRPQREELFRLREKRIAGTFTPEDEARAQALQQEMRASMESVRTETEGILTAEQKAKLEQLKQERKAKHGERKARHEQRMKERQERLNNNLQ